MEHYSTPQEGGNASGKRLLTLAAVVLILIIGFLVAKYWPRLASPAPAAIPGTGSNNNIETVQLPVNTPAQKAQLLESVQGSSSAQGSQEPASSSASAISPDAHAQILQAAQTSQKGNVPAQPSEEEKMQLLQSAEH